jgi:hypothetical protein
MTGFSMSAAHVAWYGERGVINALVTKLAAPPGSLAAACNFLQTISWSRGNVPDWIAGRKEVTYIVEMGLAQFGSPDLILVAMFESDKPRVVFVEGKVCGYAKSAMPNNPGMAAEKFDSSINGQIALKYRFSQALQCWDGQRTRIVEPESLWLAYKRSPMDGGLDDPAERPRRVQKPAVLALLEKHSLFQLPADHFHFVALTSDDLPFWNEQVLQGKPRPLFLDACASPRDVWENIAPRVGWLGYKAIRDKLEPGEAFEEALATMKVALELEEPAIVELGQCNALLQERLAAAGVLDRRFRLVPGTKTSTIRRPRGQPRNLIAKIINDCAGEELRELDPRFAAALIEAGVQVRCGKVELPNVTCETFVEQVLCALQATLAGPYAGQE